MSTSGAGLLAQGVRLQVSAAALEPALLPGRGVSARGPPLAGGAAADRAASGRGGQSPACRGGAGTPRSGAQRTSRVGVPSGPMSRGYAGAWSRSRGGRRFFSTPVCDRPGCHERPRNSLRNPARYCGPVCRAAVRQVRDRERKWRSRSTLAGRIKRTYEYAAANQRRPGCGVNSATADAAGRSRAPPE
jgi:hypothetical protein